MLLAPIYIEESYSLTLSTATTNYITSIVNIQSIIYSLGILSQSSIHHFTFVNSIDIINAYWLGIETFDVIHVHVGDLLAYPQNTLAYSSHAHASLVCMSRMTTNSSIQSNTSLTQTRCTIVQSNPRASDVHPGVHLGKLETCFVSFRI